MHTKMAALNSNRENLERICFVVRDGLADVANKVDTLQIELKDIQGNVRLQNKMFDSQAQMIVS